MLYPCQSAVLALLDKCTGPCVILLQGGLGKTYLKSTRPERPTEVWLEEEQVGGMETRVLKEIASKLGGRIVVNLLPGSPLTPEDVEDDDDVPLEFDDGVRAWVFDAYCPHG